MVQLRDRTAAANPLVLNVHIPPCALYRPDFAGQPATISFDGAGLSFAPACHWRERRWCAVLRAGERLHSTPARVLRLSDQSPVTSRPAGCKRCCRASTGPGTIVVAAQTTMATDRYLQHVAVAGQACLHPLSSTLRSVRLTPTTQAFRIGFAKAFPPENSRERVK